MRKSLKIILFLLLVFALTGCARIVTDKALKSESGEDIRIREAEFTFTFAGAPALNNNYNYYLIITTTNIGVNPLIFNGGDSLVNYFASPDDESPSTNQRFIQQYYNDNYEEYDNLQLLYRDYFSKWYEYFMFNNGMGFGVFTDPAGYAGPYVWANPLNHYDFRHINMRNNDATPGNNQLRLTIPCPPQSVFYFALVTVDDTGSQRMMGRGTGLIEVKAQTIGTVINDQPVNTYLRSGITDALNVQRYTVKIMEY